MAYKIDPNKCIACHTCMGVCPCPVCAISVDADGKCVIDPNKCMSCGMCATQCPVSAIAPEAK